MRPGAQILNLDWHGIAVSITVWPDWSAAYRAVYGYPLAHIELRADRPLPITETGYLSHFVTGPILDEWGGVLPYIASWLDAASRDPEWIRRQAEARQLTLF